MMKSISAFASLQARARPLANTTVMALPNTTLSRRADAGLRSVTQDFCDCVGGVTVDTRANALAQYDLTLTTRPALKNMALWYTRENRFMAVNYNLCITSRGKLPHTNAHGSEARLHYDGALSATHPYLAFTCSNKPKALGEIFQHPLVLERLAILKLTDMRVSVDQRGSWEITALSLVGSATWNLIPPIFQLIRFKEHEIRSLIELYDLIIDALQRTALVSEEHNTTERELAQ